ncbi:Asp-tRNA(Asn)/Glu-tRNA(Gln) amidotransferase subunit GatC [Capilliphycus salinus ALCB114379]|uniref:Asp-tRNA(Asn)/Glu-tRNA(Gln) amidotransferase subunit GatC n=1 Tax=Capilliphycus salinus TaxID=2768948 RepID=UPI0039A5B2B5
MIDREQVRKVAHLARLQITPEEEEKFTSELGGILEYFEQLKELDTENIQPTTRAIDVSNISRADALKPYENRDSLLGSAPESDGDYFKVPKILKEE